LGIVVIVIAVVAGIFYHSTESAGAQAGRYRFAVGRPGPGAVSPLFRLPSTDGHSLDLMAFRGRMVLLYFMEGVTCPACWSQLKDIDEPERLFEQVQAFSRLVEIARDEQDDRAILRQPESTSRLALRPRAEDLGVDTVRDPVHGKT